VTRITTLGILVLIGACQPDMNDEAWSEDLPRSTYAEEAVSFVAPEGWDARRDRETLLFVEPAGRHSRSTIAIRSIPVAGWSEPRTPENILPSTETVLRSLPAAQVSGPTKFEHSAYPAVAYDVTFTPRSGRGTKYHRRHIVIFSPGRIVHVLHTGPRNHLVASEAPFRRLVDSLREEG
jgi:hypothetical protein